MLLITLVTGLIKYTTELITVLKGSTTSHGNSSRGSTRLGLGYEIAKIVCCIYVCVFLACFFLKKLGYF